MQHSNPFWDTLPRNLVLNGSYSMDGDGEWSNISEAGKQLVANLLQVCTDKYKYTDKYKKEKYIKKTHSK